MVATASKATHDEWGAVLAQLCHVWGELHEQQDAGVLDELVVGARALDAPVLEAWARSLAALAGVRAGEPDGRDAALAATTVARNLGVAGARLIAHLALAETSTDPIEEQEQQAEAAALARETGLRAPGDIGRAGLKSTATAGPNPGAQASPLAMRLLGGFELELNGEAADLSAIRPRARMLLRLLALNSGRRVHHETIEAALWPDADATSSARNLHVAVSALRRILEPAAMRGSFQLIRREGDAYVMAVPDGAFIDLLEFDRTLAAGHRARAAGDADGAERHFSHGLALYRADLLPEDGPAEWVAERRDSCASRPSTRHRHWPSCCWSAVTRPRRRVHARPACVSSGTTTHCGGCLSRHATRLAIRARRRQRGCPTTRCLPSSVSRTLRAIPCNELDLASRDEVLIRA